MEWRSWVGIHILQVGIIASRFAQAPEALRRNGSESGVGIPSESFGIRNLLCNVQSATIVQIVNVFLP
jgi:hypothetical protein